MEQHTITTRAYVNMLPTPDNSIGLLNHEVDFTGDTTGQYRILVGGKDVKYIYLGLDIIPDGDRTPATVMFGLLPTLPAGDWNVGHVAKDPTTGRPFFTGTLKTQLVGIETTWHPRTLDHLELSPVGRLRSNILKVRHPAFDVPVVYKFAEFPEQIPWLEAETRAYGLIRGSGVGPEFLGHVTEAGRVIGFLIEYLEGERPAHEEDLAACQVALSKLHARGVKHGDTNKFNFVIDDDGSATLIDFETSVGASEVELQEEMEGLGLSLRVPPRDDDVRAVTKSLRKSDSAVDLDTRA